MNKRIKSALISVYYKDGLETILPLLDQLGITIYTTGGTQKFIEDAGYKCISVETLTSYPSILGGRVKTLHPAVFGGILGRRDNEQDLEEMKKFNIPAIDLVIVDLYPFQETVESTTDDKAIIEKIDVGGPSMIRAAAKNHQEIVVISDRGDYRELRKILKYQSGETTYQQRRDLAASAFNICTKYDLDISRYFSEEFYYLTKPQNEKQVLRYGENPHQHAEFTGRIHEIFQQLHGKELSYNNLVDVDAAIQLMDELGTIPYVTGHGSDAPVTFAIIKHTNVCGCAAKQDSPTAWKAALAGDPESAFGGVIITNSNVTLETASGISELFFEVLIAPSFDEDAFKLLSVKKNRILLKQKASTPKIRQRKTILNGTLTQEYDYGNYLTWKEEGARDCTDAEKKDLSFANIISKHLKSNAIALVKDLQLLGKGCGQTSRIDSLRQAIEKSSQFDHSLKAAALASDAFFPFDDCVKIAHQAGITAFIQPGGSIRDKDSIDYCKQKGLAMVITGMRHFKH